MGGTRDNPAVPVLGDVHPDRARAEPANYRVAGVDEYGVETTEVPVMCKGWEFLAAMMAISFCLNLHLKWYTWKRDGQEYTFWRWLEITSGENG